MATRQLPSQAYLHECFLYDPGTGVLIWLRRPRGHFPDEATFKKWNTRFAGKIAGGKASEGYMSVGIGDRRYFQHRVIWKFVTGEDHPYIDHRNRNGRDNRFDNLRPATRAQNEHNRARQRRNKSGYKGVSKHSRGNSFVAYIYFEGRQRNLGSFATAEAAYEAYRSAGMAIHGEFWHEKGA